MSDHHESPIKTPQQLITVILLSFIVPITIIMLLAGWVADGEKPTDKSAAFTDEAVAARITPVAENVYKDASNAVAKTGEQVYKEVCFGCHDAGLVGSPKFGDKAAWGARLALGLEKLTASVIKGKGAMGARGGNSDLSDTEVLNAVAYMGKAAGAAFKEAAPAAAEAPKVDAAKKP